MYFRYLVYVILGAVRLNKQKARSKATALSDMLANGINPGPRDVFQWPGTTQLVAIGTFAVLVGKSESIGVYQFALNSLEGKLAQEDFSCYLGHGTESNILLLYLCADFSSDGLRGKFS